MDLMEIRKKIVNLLEKYRPNCQLKEIQEARQSKEGLEVSFSYSDNYDEEVKNGNALFYNGDIKEYFVPDYKTFENKILELLDSVCGTNCQYNDYLDILQDEEGIWVSFHFIKDDVDYEAFAIYKNGELVRYDLGMEE